MRYMAICCLREDGDGMTSELALELGSGLGGRSEGVGVCGRLAVNSKESESAMDSRTEELSRYDWMKSSPRSDHGCSSCMGSGWL